MALPICLSDEFAIFWYNFFFFDSCNYDTRGINFALGFFMLVFLSVSCCYVGGVVGWFCLCLHFFRYCFMVSRHCLLWVVAVSWLCLAWSVCCDFFVASPGIFVTACVSLVSLELLVGILVLLVISWFDLGVSKWYQN